MRIPAGRGRRRSAILYYAWDFGRVWRPVLVMAKKSEAEGIAEIDAAGFFAVGEKLGGTFH